MNIAVIGAGAIGSVVAAYLHKAGLEVVLAGKKDQVDAINQHGLRIKGALEFRNNVVERRLYG